ncbi:MAG: hypothetical protein GX993_05830 [Bacteroidales bacterium]|nr:hypothetical protein [Bacteroidales bacterium]
MNGIEIDYNGDIQKIAVKDGMILLNIFVNDSKGNDSIYASTTDYEKGIKSVYYDFTPITIGDRFKISIKEIDAPSAPLKEQSDNTRRMTKLEQFKRLEEELKREGAI